MTSKSSLVDTLSKSDMFFRSLDLIKLRKNAFIRIKGLMKDLNVDYYQRQEILIP